MIDSQLGQAMRFLQPRCPDEGSTSQKQPPNFPRNRHLGPKTVNSSAVKSGWLEYLLYFSGWFPSGGLVETCWFNEVVIVF